MKITVPKASLVEALGPFAKVPSLDAALIISSTKHQVRCRASSPQIQLETTPTGAAADTDGAFRIDGKALRSALETTPAGTVTLDLKDASLVVTSDGGASMTLAVSAADTTDAIAVPAKLPGTPTPTGFCGFLLQALQAASTDESRASLTGVHVSSQGIVGTDGRQLLELPLPMPSLKQEMTLPRSPLYNALRKRCWLSISSWTNDGGKSYACITGLDFKLVVQTIDKAFPNYRAVIPDAKSLDADVAFSADYMDALKSYLKGLPKGESLEMTCTEERVDFRCVDRCVSMPGKMMCANPKAAVACNPEYLLRALTIGYTGIRFNSKVHAPIVATGGPGTYLWMPMSSSPASVSSSDTSVAASDASARPAPSSVPVPIVPSITNTKEVPKMSVTVPVPTTYRSAEPVAVKPSDAPAVPADPMLDLATAINEMRSQIDSLQSHLLDVGRKLREASTAQRQKERVYLEATRKLERIRLAM